MAETTHTIVTYAEASERLNVPIRRLQTICRQAKLRLYGFKWEESSHRWQKQWSLEELAEAERLSLEKGRAGQIANGHRVSQSRKGRTFPKGYPVLPYGPDLPICPIIATPKAQKPPSAPKPPKKTKKTTKAPVVSFEQPTAVLVAHVLELRKQGHKAGAIAKLVNQPLALVWPILAGAPKCVNSTAQSAVNHLSSWKKA